MPVASFVQLPDGRQKSVRVENLCPQLPEPQSAPSSSSKCTDKEGAAGPGESGEESALPQKLRLEPARIPCSGAEVVIEARDLAGTISEVWVDGTSCEVLEDLSKRDSPAVRVRVPACRNRAGGAALVEVRSVDWARHMIREEAANYFPLLTFATCSPNIELTARQGDSETPYLDVATRQKGLISAVALTSELSPVTGSAALLLPGEDRSDGRETLEPDLGTGLCVASSACVALEATRPHSSSAEHPFGHPMATCLSSLTSCPDPWVV